ncbi:NAD(P)H-hydrate epimerase [Microbacterium sp. LRZ72]|uniref:NAD(P)H-hydrate epimerase n=1 Tax=Microbacterium sp. LRZ72 TaxID=2942481 RepID=UPI0029BB914E|nr:NAD(P)H-hydrate epimerase [Microbacterium sp. LRZ72]MDX2377142.1 NAD(P)H-hydrate epimerase [Microbacterium sp. LRZ72]
MSATPGTPASTPAYTAAAVRRAEQPLLEAGEPLMARAAAAIAQIARELVPDGRGPVLVLAGRGNNGGDALFAAATLAEAGYAVDVLLTSDGAHSAALGAARRAGVVCCGLDDVREAASDYRLVIDGILGIGTSSDPALRGIARATVAALAPELDRNENLRVLAVDLPSGLHPDDGTADGTVLPADVTVTMGAVKAGLVRGRGPEFTGQIVLVDLGLTPALERLRPEVETTAPVRLLTIDAPPDQRA